MATLRAPLLMLVKFLSLAAALPFGAAWSGDEPSARQEFVLGPVSSCPASTPVSCTNTTVQPDLCCFEAPSGLLLQAQFWDTNPSTGPNNSWTIHGLFPDHCDGGFDQHCDPSRQENNITGVLEAAGQTSLLNYMDTYWKDIKEDDNDLWSHEWNKHGTCLSTLSSTCVDSTDQAIVYYLESTVELFKDLPTYDWLAAAGIIPSSTAKYSRNEIASALEARYGVTVGLECRSKTLKEVYYYHHLKGSIHNGQYVRVNALRPGSCPSNGIKYPPKH